MGEYMKISSELLELVFDSVVAGFLDEVKKEKKYGVPGDYVNPDIGTGYTAGEAKYNGRTLIIGEESYSDSSVNVDMLCMNEPGDLYKKDKKGEVPDINGLVRTVNAGQWWKTETDNVKSERYNFTLTEADAMAAHAIGRYEQVGKNAGMAKGLRGQYYGLVLRSNEKRDDYTVDVMAASNATEVSFGTLTDDYKDKDWIKSINKLSRIMSESTKKNVEIEEERHEDWQRYSEEQLQRNTVKLVVDFLTNKDNFDAKKLKEKDKVEELLSRLEKQKKWQEHTKEQATKMGRSGMKGTWKEDNSGKKGSELKAVRCTHGMIRSMGALICSESDASHAVCSEMSLTQGTTKAGACITCTMYMWSCGAGFNRLHLGASELWSLPSGINISLKAIDGLYEAKNIKDLDAEPVRVNGKDTDWGHVMLNKKNKQWGNDIQKWFEAGYNLACEKYESKVKATAGEVTKFIEDTMEMNLGKRLHISEVYLMSLGLGRKARDIFTEGLKKG